MENSQYRGIKGGYWDWVGQYILAENWRLNYWQQKTLAEAPASKSLRGTAMPLNFRK